MATTHTPGPWEFRPSYNKIDFDVIAPAGEAELGTWLVAPEVRWEGNARLIAAAPELLAVAQMAKQVALMELGQAESPDFDPQQLLDAAGAAIARATVAR